MNKQQDTPNPLDPFGAWRSMRDANMENWSKMMIEVVNSEAYSQAMSKFMDSYLTVSQPLQQLLNTTTTRMLTQLNMPTRDEITRLAERLTNIETLLDDMDAKIDEIQHTTRSSSKQNRSANTTATTKEKQEKSV